ncbi:hypothetical protein QAD02_003512 [Eretmocerus hayati]|uniref:Uncharacterized protein n=1 Tax=Eretmocerus hayati TaxID=131215 RepID=A0ACC2NN10_9HYME|nr:hypothetical protein QAD02_003512 [Eretmocerus hayati]
MSHKQGRKRKEEERSPESKVENTVTKKNFAEDPKKNLEKEDWEEADNNNSKQLSESEYIGEGMETLLAHITQIQEDMKELKEGMLGKMEGLIEGLRAENVREVEELDERITNLEVKDKEKDQKYEEILNRVRAVEERELDAKARNRDTGKEAGKGGNDWNIMKRRLEENEGRKEIMVNKKKLKGTEIYIERDLTWKERDTRRKLKEFAKEQIQKGRKAITRDTHAIIDGQIWKWSERENKPFQTGKTWKGTQRQERERVKMRIITWNIAGLKTLTNKQWDYLKGFEIICITETWIEGKDRNWVNRKLKEHDCTVVEASREKRKGRASGGIMVATKKSLRAETEAIGQEVIRSELQMGKEK